VELLWIAIVRHKPSPQVAHTRAVIWRSTPAASIPFGFEDGFVAVSVFELDSEGAVVEQFGGSFAIDLVAFLAAGPVKANRVAGIFDFEAGLQGARDRPLRRSLRPTKAA
jgi:hypothetical protein